MKTILNTRKGMMGMMGMMFYSYMEMPQFPNWLNHHADHVDHTQTVALTSPLCGHAFEENAKKNRTE